MGNLAWIFFCSAPFALFCSESGTGLILCPTFIILGFICKWIGDIDIIDMLNIRIEPTEEQKAKMYDLWKFHYKDRMERILAQKDSINEGLMAIKDQEARRWATTICGYNDAPVPPEYVQELFARENGVITNMMIKERNEKKDKIQVGKYILMNELMERYDTTRISRGAGKLYYFPRTRIKRDLDKIKASNGRYITEYWAYNKYEKSIKEIWNGLSQEERDQATGWVEEYERLMINTAREYAEGRRRDDNIEMDF